MKKDFRWRNESLY